MSQQPWYRHAVPLVLAASLAIPAIAAAQGIPTPHVAISTAPADIASARTAYQDAFNAKDAAKVSEMFTADAHMVEADGSETVGIAAITKKNAAEASSWPHLSIESSGLKIYGNTAIDYGTATAQPASGAAMTSRYVAVLRHGVNGWKLESVANVPEK